MKKSEKRLGIGTPVVYPRCVGLAHMEYLSSCHKLSKITKENVVYYQLA